MAAYIIIPNEAEWPIIRNFLERLEGGAIVIPADVALELSDKFGVMPQDIFNLNGTFVDYDFGGEADIFVDVMWIADHYAMNTIREELGIEEDDEED